jgi:transcription initiation factor IIE alpha subunit
MINEQKIPCPVCSTQIPFEVNSLLRGEKFACPKCHSIVAIAQESIQETKKVVEQYEKLKSNGL